MEGKKNCKLTRIWQGVEIAAEQERNEVGVRFLIWRYAAALLEDIVDKGLQFMHQHHRLDKFDIRVLRIPVDVGSAHEQSLAGRTHFRSWKKKTFIRFCDHRQNVGHKIDSLKIKALN